MTETIRFTKKDSGREIELGYFDGHIEVVGPVKDLTLKHGRITGELRLRPKKKELFDDNLHPNHVKLLREEAPARCNAVDILFLGQRPGHQLYVGPGCTEFHGFGLGFEGVSEGPSTYFGREGAGHTLSHCLYKARILNRREVIAVDASEDCSICDTDLLRCKNGGIYAYRNSGEDGVVRYTKPKRLILRRNRLDLSGMNLIRFGFGPIIPEIPYGIILGSRGGRFKDRNGNRRYADLDKGKAKKGSAIDNRDFVQYASVSDNLFKGDPFMRWVLDSGRKNGVVNSREWT
ncbi:MAG: hypothetical protein AAFX65_10560 [Cyanobacteria bacterium J06638_7]